MKILIIEDEQLAAERLSILLHRYDSNIEILACLDSIEDSVNWLTCNAQPDLLLMDIHLSDGHCFEIFNQVKITAPVIFITAYDHYSLKSFDYFSIAYVLKPVSFDALSRALNKYKEVSTIFRSPESGKMISHPSYPSQQYKERFLGKIGNRTYFISSEDIACILSENKQVYLMDKKGIKYLLNYTLDRIMPLLDPVLFFRVNRKLIIHSKVIEQIKPYYNNRLKILMKEIKFNEELVISRERVHQFKKWAEGMVY